MRPEVGFALFAVLCLRRCLATAWENDGDGVESVNGVSYSLLRVLLDVDERQFRRPLRDFQRQRPRQSSIFVNPAKLLLTGSMNFATPPEGASASLKSDLATPATTTLPTSVATATFTEAGKLSKADHVSTPKPPTFGHVWPTHVIRSTPFPTLDVSVKVIIRKENATDEEDVTTTSDHELAEDSDGINTTSVILTTEPTTTEALETSTTAAVEVETDATSAAQSDEALTSAAAEFTDKSHTDPDDVSFPNDTSTTVADPDGPEEWSPWIDKGTCSDDCGACGVIQRQRSCISFKERGVPCRGEYKTVRPCNAHPCKFPRPSCCPPYDLLYKDGKFWCGPQKDEDVYNRSYKV